MDVYVQQEQCIIIKFLVMWGVSGAEIHCRLLSVFKSKTLSCSRVFEWCTHFRSGHQSVSDDDRAGAPHSAVMAVNYLCLCIFGLSGRYSSRLCAFWIYSECRLLQYITVKPVRLPAVTNLVTSDWCVIIDQICYGKTLYCSTIMLHHKRLVKQ